MNFIKMPAYFIVLYILMTFFPNTIQASSLWDLHQDHLFTPAPLPVSIMNEYQPLEDLPSISPELFDKASFSVWSPSPEEEMESFQSFEHLKSFLKSDQPKLSINFYEETVTQEDIKALQSYASYIWGLNADQTWMNNEGLLLIIQSFPHLRTLEVPNNSLDGEALSILSSLTHLDYLDISNNLLNPLELNKFIQTHQSIEIIF